MVAAVEPEEEVRRVIIPGKAYRLRACAELFRTLSSTGAHTTSIFDRASHPMIVNLLFLVHISNP